MKSQSKILKRIDALYIIFFLIVSVSLVVGLTGIDFRAGFNEGFEHGMPGKQMLSPFVELKNDISVTGYNIPVYTNADGSVVGMARTNTIDLRLEGPGTARLSPVASTWGMMIMTLAMLLYLGVFVVMLVILVELRKSARTNNVFSRNAITLTRMIGAMLITASILGDTGNYIRNNYAARFFEGSDFVIANGFPITFKEIIMGVVVLFIAEIFAIGYDLTEEQKLTI
ncbi:MAG: DUF2975 domain-containing protein [Rikenellaceae bacterium]|jgi:hypothetical protein|nr:DUF2975 domain-containing protein [Rikenellaceae bacterium]